MRRYDLEENHDPVADHHQDLTSHPQLESRLTAWLVRRFDGPAAKKVNQLRMAG